jgi:hypothetical protein
MSAHAALEIAVRLVCVARLVSLAEYLLRWRQFRPGGLLDFVISQPLRQTRRSIIQKIGAIGDEVNLKYFPFLLVLDGVCSAILLVRPTLAAVILIAVLSQLLVMKRIEIAIDGSDQMVLIVLVASALGLISHDSTAPSVACVFLAANLCLAYFAAGAYKAAAVQWIRGEGLARVVSTTTFGCPRLARHFLRSTYVPLVAGWTVILWECIFPTALVAPEWLLLGLLTLGMMFHIMCGLIMGLTNFPLAFGASYPAVIYVNNLITHSIHARIAWPITLCLLAAAPFILARQTCRRDASPEPASRI